MKRAAFLAPLLLIAACGGGGTSATGSSPAEDKALDEAAASLDANTIDSNAADVVDEDDGDNESQPK